MVKGRNVSESLLWRRSGESGVKGMVEEAKEIETPILARRSLPSNGMGQVGITRKK